MDKIINIPVKKRYSLFGLAKATGYSYHLLKSWQEKNWLQPCSSTGIRKKYTEDDLRAAEQMSLGSQILKIKTPVRMRTAEETLAML